MIATRNELQQPDVRQEDYKSPWGAVGAIGGALITSALAPSPQGPNPGQASANIYTPTGLGAADTGWQQIFGQELGLTGPTGLGQLPGLYGNTLQQQLGVSGQPLIGAGQQAGQQYGNLAGMAGLTGMLQQGQGLQANQNAQNLIGGGQQVFNMGLDPRQALYNRTAQQFGEQVNAGQALRGLGNSPEGAGEFNQAMSNFNIDWQNAQLARALQGLQGFQGANQTGAQLGALSAQDLSTGLGTMGQQPGFTLQSAQTPITSQLQAYGMPAQAGNQYNQYLQGLLSSLSGIGNQPIPYMNQGQGMQQNAFNAALGAANFGAGQNQAMGNLLGSGFGALGQSTGSSFPTWLNNLWSGGGGGGVNAPSGIGSNAWSSYYGGGGGDSFLGVGAQPY